MYLRPRIKIVMKWHCVILNEVNGLNNPRRATRATYSALSITTEYTTEENGYNLHIGKNI